jgi:hypothetical protein
MDFSIPAEAATPSGAGMDITFWPEIENYLRTAARRRRLALLCNPTHFPIPQILHRTFFQQDPTIRRNVECHERI